MRLNPLLREHGFDDFADAQCATSGKTFELEFCTVARWKDGEIVEENL